MFQSHIDGSRHELTPERAMEIQRLLGSDIQMQLDECVRLPCAACGSRAGDAAVAALGGALARRRSARSRGRALFGIVQGGVDAGAAARERARTGRRSDFDGYAIGGLAVGEPQAVMLAMIETVEPHLPADKPRYLMGVGTPDDLVQALARGVDMFDCVMPTRAGRHGLAYTRHGRINLRNARHADDPRPIDDALDRAGGARLFARLSAPSRQIRRDPRHDGADGDQSRLLSGPDGRHARGDRRPGGSPISSPRPRRAGRAAKAEAPKSKAAPRPKRIK